MAAEHELKRALVLLMDRDRVKWSALPIRRDWQRLIDHGLLGRSLGDFKLKAAISACYVPIVRADFLMKLGRSDDATQAWRRAAALAINECERQLLLARASAAH